jgi:hypothetical protein
VRSGWPRRAGRIRHRPASASPFLQPASTASRRSLLPPPAAWSDTALDLPEAWAGSAAPPTLVDALTGRERALPPAGLVPVRELLDELPLALLAAPTH